MCVKHLCVRCPEQLLHPSSYRHATITSLTRTWKLGAFCMILPTPAGCRTHTFYKGVPLTRGFRQTRNGLCSLRHPCGPFLGETPDPSSRDPTSTPTIAHPPATPSLHQLGHGARWQPRRLFGHTASRHPAGSRPGPDPSRTHRAAAGLGTGISSGCRTGRTSPLLAALLPCAFAPAVTSRRAARASAPPRAAHGPALGGRRLAGPGSTGHPLGPGPAAVPQGFRPAHNRCRRCPDRARAPAPPPLSARRCPLRHRCLPRRLRGAQRRLRFIFPLPAGGGGGAGRWGLLPGRGGGRPRRWAGGPVGERSHGRGRGAREPQAAGGGDGRQRKAGCVVGGGQPGAREIGRRVGCARGRLEHAWESVRGRSVLLHCGGSGPSREGRCR